MRTRIVRLIALSLIDVVPGGDTQPQTTFLRRRIVVAITLVVGAVLLRVSLSIAPGEPRFYLAGMAIALTWLVGGLLSGPLYLSRITFRDKLRRPILTPFLTGLLAAGVFLAGAFVVRMIPPLRDYINSVLSYADNSSLALITVVTVANGLAEEVFFRGALFAAIGCRGPVLLSTAIYALVTVASGNPCSYSPRSPSASSSGCKDGPPEECSPP